MTDKLEAKIRAALEAQNQKAKPCVCRRRKTGPNPRREQRDLDARAKAAAKCPVHATTPFEVGHGA